MNPFEILGISSDADDKTVRQAYLAGLRQFPPDKDPQGFQRLRAAYEKVDTEMKRIAVSLDWPYSLSTKEEILSVFATEGEYCKVGPEPWLELIRANVKKPEM